MSPRSFALQKLRSRPCLSWLEPEAPRRCTSAAAAIPMLYEARSSETPPALGGVRSAVPQEEVRSCVCGVRPRLPAMGCTRPSWSSCSMVLCSVVIFAPKDFEAAVVRSRVLPSVASGKPLSINPSSPSSCADRFRVTGGMAPTPPHTKLGYLLPIQRVAYLDKRRTVYTSRAVRRVGGACVSPAHYNLAHLLRD